MRITTAAMQESRCFLSPKRRAKKSGIVMAPSLAEYRRRRRATISQLRYVPMARADGRPRHLRQSAEVGKARQTHQKVAAHVARLSAHGRDDRAHLAPAEVEVVRAAAAPFLPKYTPTNTIAAR